jgi:hypothetical protein
VLSICLPPPEGIEHELARSFYSLARAVLSVELRGRVAGRMIDIQRSKSSRGFHPETVDLRSASSVLSICLPPPEGMEYELARSFYSLARAVLSVELQGRVAGRMIDIQRSKSSRGFHPVTVDDAPLRLC